MSEFDQITNQATEREGLYLLPAHGANHLKHVIPLPSGMCPRSRNPKSGTLTLEYSPLVNNEEDMALEVVSLWRVVSTLHTQKDGPRSAESLARRVALMAATSLGVAVHYELDILLSPGDQRLIAKGMAWPSRS